MAVPEMEYVVTKLYKLRILFIIIIIIIIIILIKFKYNHTYFVPQYYRKTIEQSWKWKLVYNIVGQIMSKQFEVRALFHFTSQSSTSSKLLLGA